MISFSKDYDKPEGIVQSIVLPDITQLHSDDSNNSIKENNFENFATLTGNILKNLILSFEIFQLPPLAGIFNDFPIVFETSFAIFKNNLNLKSRDSYSIFINDLFSLFDPSKNPAGDLVQILAPLTIQIQATRSINITDSDITDSNSSININNLFGYLKEIDFSVLNKNQLEIIESYANYFIIKFIASNFEITFTPAPPAPPIVLPLIVTDPLTIDQVKIEFKEKIDNIVANINSI